MNNHGNIESISKIMATYGAGKKITTPSYAEFIEVLAIVFDINKSDDKEKRPREMSESNSMFKRQLVHSDVISRLFSLWEIKNEEHNFLKNCFLKLENMLSNFKATLICSPHSSRHGDAAFFKYVAFPQLLEVLRFAAAERQIAAALEMLRYLAMVVYQGGTANDNIKRLKKEVLMVLKKQECPDFKITLGKLDARSFPKTKSIEDILRNLRDEISQKGRCGETEDHLVSRIKFKFLGAKAAFQSLKLLDRNPHTQPLTISQGLIEIHRELCGRYVCNEDIDERDYDFINEPSFTIIKNIYFESIENTHLEEVPAEIARSPTLLIQYKNHALLPWYVYQKFVRDLERGIVDDIYVKHFEKDFFLSIKNYQYGHIAVDISRILIAIKIKRSRSLPHQSLEPLAMALMANQEIRNSIAVCWETPFGMEDLEAAYTSDLNIGQAVFTFNEYVKIGAIQDSLCNPLEGLDQMLKHIFDQGETWDGSFPSTVKIKRPVKMLSLDLYDALKGINGLLGQFHLVDDCDLTRVNTSLAGEFINRYLALDTSEKTAILKKIDPAKFQADVEKMEQKKDGLSEEAILGE